MVDLTEELIFGVFIYFLDLTFHIDTHTYEPYRKDDNPPTYIHKQSNRPPAITRNIPGMIQRMISANSSNEEIFNRHKGIYEEALRKSGYKSKMIYVPQDDKGPRRKKVRYPLQFYWNPPYNRRVKTPVGNCSALLSTSATQGAVSGTTYLIAIR